MLKAAYSSYKTILGYFAFLFAHNKAVCPAFPLLVKLSAHLKTQFFRIPSLSSYIKWFPLFPLLFLLVGISLLFYFFLINHLWTYLYCKSTLYIIHTMSQQDTPPTPTTPTADNAKHALVCSKCNLPLGDQLVRALDGAFHPECFTCWVSGALRLHRLY